MIRTLSLTGAAALICAPLSAQVAGSTPVSEAELRETIAYLASDELAGRYPGTPGETATAHYIARRLAAAGFVGAAEGGSFYQPVPLVELHNSEGMAGFRDASGAAVPVGEIAWRAPGGSATIRNAPVVYVGHGVDAEGRVRADVRGKIALLLIADRPGEDALSNAERRAALVEAGAVATILLPPPISAFATLQRGFATPRIQLAEAVSRAQAEAVVSAGAGEALLRAGGLDPAMARAAAAQDDYAGQALTLTADVDATSYRRAYNSYNVVGRLPGRRSGTGAVLLMGHWDHLGLCRPEGAEDRICNGAVDNASGIAVILAAAERLGAGARPDRDIVVVATTAEEQGLLGARHFANSMTPVVPLGDIVVNLNIDTVAIAPRGAPMAMVGRGTTPLEAGVDAVARGIGRAIDDDLEGNAFIQRQDGWELTKVGVPSIMAGGSFADMTLLQAFLGGSYHGPDDELTDAVPLGGAADDADLHVALARHFANLSTWPGAAPRP